MRPRSHGLVSAGRGLSVLVPVVSGVLVVAAIAALVGVIEPIVAIAWFGSEDQARLSPFAARWIAVFLVASATYGILRGVEATAETLKNSKIIERARRISAFQVLLSWLVALQLLTLGEALRDRGPVSLAYEEQALLVCSLVSLLWPLACGRRIELKIVRDVFLVSLLVLGSALVILEPDVPVTWAVALGLTSPPLDIVETGLFYACLPYLAPLGPIVWSAFDAWSFADRGAAR